MWFTEFSAVAEATSLAGDLLGPSANIAAAVHKNRIQLNVQMFVFIINQLYLENIDKTYLFLL